ncbi:MAG: polymerase [Betaproteobacteria bacterium]|nr:polymerase [Betaproteobacteria bacterium]
MKTLLLVDGSSYLYRAFHALPDLRNTKGEPTGAVYGVINMLRKLHKDTRADYSAVIFDAKGRTFRDEIYPEYKATRDAMPDDLSFQIQALNETIKAMGWPMLTIDGVEADDVIGTLTKQAEAAGMRVIISTGDKDMAQLVSPAVTLVNTMSNEILDEAGVEKKFGVRPERFIDYLTLIGDSIDNIPGVDKVGPKTACKWLVQYGTLDEILKRAGEIGGVVGENLRKKLDWLPQARELLTIKCDVPLPAAPDALEITPQDKTALAALFERFEFKTWLRELKDGAVEEERVAVEAAAASAVTLRSAQACEYETVLTEEQLNAWLLRLEGADLAALDTETTNIDAFRAQLVGISLSVARACAAYIPVGHTYAGAPEQLPLALVLERLRPWLEDAERPKVGQNMKYDMHVLENYGIRLAGVQHDTLLQSYVLESHKSHDMDNLSERHLSLKTITYDDVTGKGAKRIPFEQVGVETATEYAAEDADITLRLHRAMAPQVEGDENMCRIYREIEMPVMTVLARIERNGVLLDVKLLGELSREFGGKMLEVEAKAHEQAGQPFNLNSPRQIQEILFDKNKLPVLKKTPSGTPSTDEDVLAQLALDHPLPKLILEYRGLSKLKSTYTDKLADMINPATGRVHTCYSQAVAVTGRLSSSEPNLQNIPIRTTEGRRIREAFIPDSGSQIVSADYSQIELRIMAHISRDESLLKAFAEGRDIHRATASEVFGIPPDELSGEQRRYAKAINFGLIYGMSAFGLSKQLDIERSAAQQYMDRYFARYPGVAAYMQRTREMARRDGYVETVFGRRLWLQEIRSGSPMRRQAAERAAINAPMQGTAADLIKLAMIQVQRWLESEGLQSKLIMQVHDELVLEVPHGELERIRVELPKLMTGVAELAVPLVVEVGAGPNWDKAH